ncbi:hypothetical protein [Flavobacterium sp.]|uniref:hypothetical protein n=1 Tax=Flavobacterium sp. TaxID=239 RepID=UPI0012244DDE|nr:hypothetical protein [Flavobacterium sp.]RZJ68961.1 MAG: DUF2975 domain-containing protein [Flavobacterium sp.]
MEIGTKQILNFLHVIAWVLFIGLCIEAGSFLFNMIYSITYQPFAAQYFGLQGLLAFDETRFVAVMSLMTIAGVLKALALYRIVKVFTDKQLNLHSPFNQEFGKFVFALSYLTLGIGIFSFWGAKNVETLVAENIVMPSLQQLRLSGADVWIFMSATLYVIGLLFKRGVEMQQESELTI